MSDTEKKPAPLRIEAETLRGLMADLFRAGGLSAGAASTMAEALVDADLQGVPSHGVMQSEGYLERLRNGTISTAEVGEIVSDRDATAVIDARDIMGHLVGDQAMALAIEKAKRYGLGAVAVRRAVHFGAANRYTLQASENGCIGMAICNARSVMPAPGGAQPLVGTNPLSISIPTREEPPVVLDMATTEGSVGKLRIAARAGRKIPETWAVSADGSPTTDPEEAMKGMLLAAGGAKGFGLALVIDLMAGLLASGAWGPTVGGMRANMEKPVDVSHFFLAIDIEHFRPLAGFLDEAQEAAERVRGSKRAPGVDRVFTPGERKWDSARKNAGTVTLAPATVDILKKLAADFGVSADVLKA